MDMSYGKTCLTGGHVLWEDMSYNDTCLTVGHVWENISYGRTFDGYVLEEDMSYR